MIIRVFRGRVKKDKMGSLDQLLTEVTTPLVKSQEGLVSYHIGKPIAPDANEFLVLTVWKGLESLKKFTGESWQQSVIPPRMAAILEDSFLHHYSAF